MYWCFSDCTSRYQIHLSLQKFLNSESSLDTRVNISNHWSAVQNPMSSFFILQRTIKVNSKISCWIPFRNAFMEIQLALSMEVQNPNTYTNFIQQHDSSLDPIPTVLGNPVTQFWSRTLMSSFYPLKKWIAGHHSWTRSWKSSQQQLVPEPSPKRIQLIFG